jgi:hypothetical protein
MSATKPLLDPPCVGWKADLPLPGAPPTEAASLGYDSPNHSDDVYLEIPRRSLAVRGILVWFSLFAATYSLWTQTLIPEAFADGDYSYLVINTFLFLVESWSVAIFYRLDCAVPRDLPLRFNRARQKIYVYNFKYRWWNPFERWHVVPVAYDWSQVRAEAWKQRGATAQGGVIIKWGVVLSIVAPGTNKVIDRFHLSTMGANEHAWAYACTYMQQGPSALPPPGKPRDHNAVPWYNLALRLAPKVKWPEAMDIESRTAPLQPGLRPQPVPLAPTPGQGAG